MHFMLLITNNGMHSLYFISYRTGISNPAPGELPSWRFQLQPQLNTPEPANQGVQGYLIITDMCVAAGLELKSAGP